MEKGWYEKMRFQKGWFLAMAPRVQTYVAINLAAGGFALATNVTTNVTTRLSEALIKVASERLSGSILGLFQKHEAAVAIVSEPLSAKIEHSTASARWIKSCVDQASESAKASAQSAKTSAQSAKTTAEAAAAGTS